MIFSFYLAINYYYLLHFWIKNVNIKRGQEVMMADGLG